MKKFATASALAMLGLVSIGAQAQTAVTDTTPGVFDATAGTPDSIGTNSGLITSLLERFAPASQDGTLTFAGPDIAVISGAVNMARINGAIDISGTNVMMSSMDNVTAKAEAIGSSSSAEAYAIAGAKLATTVIGAMNSATVEVGGRTSNATSTLTNKFSVDTLAGMDGGTTLGIGSISGGLPTAGSLSTITASLGSATLFSAGTGTGAAQNLQGLTSEMSSSLTATVNDLQNIGVFNSAINVAALDAGIKIAATVDPNAWFLNPQSGVVNVANISAATTAIGVMNSGITKLTASLK